MRWSPHSTGDRRRFLVVEVADPGLALYEIDSPGKHGVVQHHAVAKCGKPPSFNAFAWSPVDESIVALGLSSGNAQLVKLREDKSKHSSDPVATFKIKQQRKCNSIAFSTQNQLAVALDKTRSDVCLNIYDANLSETSQDPLRRLCAAEVVSSVRFFPSQPQELLIGAQRSLIRLYDLRDGRFSASGNGQTSTRNVNNIALDPLDDNYFASSGSTDEPNVSVWDKRWTSPSESSSGAVLDFKPALGDSSRATVWSLRFSGQRRGRLAICGSTGELRVIDIAGSDESTSSISNYLPVNPHGGTAWTCSRYVSQSRTVKQSARDEQQTRTRSERTIAFDWMQEDNTDMAAQPLLTLGADREITLQPVGAQNAYADLNGRNDLSLIYDQCSITEPPLNALHAVASTRVNGNTAAEDFGPREYEGEVEAEEHLPLQCSLASPQVGKLLAASSIQRERCKRGYRFDCAKNAQIVAGHWHLQRMWEIAGRFKEQGKGNAMVSEGVDMSYVGVAGLWSESIGSGSERRLPSSRTTVYDAIVALNTAKEIPAFEGERTDFPEHRQLCLAICGWKFTTDTLEAECQQLIERGLYYQAIVQAVLHEYKHIALNLLRTLIRSKTVPNIGLGALLASNEINDEQREMCLWMAADTEDPALKALLTFLTTGNWRDVMKTNYLHLGYRVALGLNYLNDTELSGFIQSETARAIKNGDLEGVLLTGLGEQAMDLLQTYLTKSNDLQTAVLAMGHTCPKYVNDMRYDMWRETYFEQMQVWHCFNERTKFTVEHNRLSRSRDGTSMLPQPPKQIALRCNHCDSSLARRDGTRSGASGNRMRVAGPAANAGTVCPTCGRHMPRCGICLLWLGTPDSTLHKGRREERVNGGMSGFTTFCVTCKHGFHAEHARMWFAKHSVCPVPDCACSCGIK